MPEKPLAALLLLMMLAPLPTAAQELRYLQVEQASRLAAGEHAMFTASCPDDLKIMAGGYKLLASELPMRDLVMVESRPVPELRQWAVTLLYEPSKPAAVGYFCISPRKGIFQLSQPGIARPCPSVPRLSILLAQKVHHFR
jgi:hypothetical protein